MKEEVKVPRLRVQYLTEEIANKIENANEKRSRNPTLFLGGKRDERLMADLFLLLNKDGFIVLCPNLQPTVFSHHEVIGNSIKTLDICCKQLMAADIAFFIIDEYPVKSESTLGEIDYCEKNGIPYYVCNVRQMGEHLLCHNIINYKQELPCF